MIAVLSPRIHPSDMRRCDGRNCIFVLAPQVVISSTRITDVADAAGGFFGAVRSQQAKGEHADVVPLPSTCISSRPGRRREEQAAGFHAEESTEQGLDQGGQLSYFRPNDKDA